MVTDSPPLPVRRMSKCFNWKFSSYVYLRRWLLLPILVDAETRKPVRAPTALRQTQNNTKGCFGTHAERSLTSGSDGIRGITCQQ